MEWVVASAELKEGDVLSFAAFPTYPYPLSVVITFHVDGEIDGEIAYRVRKREEAICETRPRPFHLPVTEGQKTFTYTDQIECEFPHQGSYMLDILFNGSVLHSLAFSVYDSSKRTELEREIIYYLTRQRGAKSVQEITRGVYNPKILNKANISEVSGRVYFALLRMKEVINLNAVDQGSLREKMNASRWKLK